MGVVVVVGEEVEGYSLSEGCGRATAERGKELVFSLGATQPTEVCSCERFLFL